MANKDRYPNPIERIYYGMTLQQVRLTKRETEICTLICRGLRNSDISTVLGDLKSRGAESHVRNMLFKTGLESRTQLAVWGLREGLVKLEDL